MLIDSHAHLTDPSMQEGLEGILQRAKDAGIEHIVNICVNPEQVAEGLLLSQKHPWIVHAAATTPHDVEKEGEKHFAAIEKYAEEGALVAIGETGLDYYYTHSEKKTQIHFLRRYLRLACKQGLPIVIHCREAFEDLFSILDQEHVEEETHLPGVMHCFTGTAYEAEQAVLRGYYVSLAGIVTFKRSEALREVAKTIPLDKLLIETDSPYLAPQSRRGKRNEPSYVLETAQLLADLHRVSIEDLASRTTANAKRLFRL